MNSTIDRKTLAITFVGLALAVAVTIATALWPTMGGEPVDCSSIANQTTACFR